MSEEKQDLTGLVESIVVPLVDHEDDVEIVSHEENGDIIIEISVTRSCHQIHQDVGACCRIT